VPATNGFAMGDPDAPIMMVEYTDYQCPFCKRYHEETFSQILSEYVETGQVYYVVKDFPLTSIHPQAVLASQATWCADEQGAYMAMADRLFATQGQWGGGDAALVMVGYATSLGLDSAAFEACLDSNRYEERVLGNLREGAGFGVTGTPGFFINGNLVSGAYPFEAFAQALDRLLVEE
jgi:protein-disulfide isomerase